MAGDPKLLVLLVYLGALLVLGEESFDGWSYTQGALLGYGVVLLYILAGGFLAVVWSDVLQGSLMLLGLVVLPVLPVLSMGGVGEVLTRLAAEDPGLLTLAGPGPLDLMSVLGIVAFLTIGLGFLGSPQVFVRFTARGALAARPSSCRSRRVGS